MSITKAPHKLFARWAICLLVYLSAYLLIGLFIISPPLAAATITQKCQLLYGGGETCLQSDALTIDKKVLHPQTQKFVDNLNITDPKHSPGDTIKFQLTIKNISSNTLSNLTIRDTLPPYLDYSSSDGTFDQTTKTITININALLSNESKTFFLLTKVKNELPENQQSACVINQAETGSKNKISQDNSMVCLQHSTPQNKSNNNLVPLNATKNITYPTTKGGIPIYAPSETSKTPNTGPEALALITLLPAGVLGYYLRRKTNY